DSDDVNKIKKQIAYLFDKIKGSDDVDEIKKQINYTLDKIKVSEYIAEIKSQIDNWLGKIKDLDDIDKIKKQINHWFDKINDDVKKFKEREIISWHNIATDSVDKDEIMKLIDKIKDSHNMKLKSKFDKIKGSDDVNEIKEQINYRLDEINGLDNVDNMKQQINNWLDKIKGLDYADEIKKQISFCLDEIKGLDDVDEITKQFLEDDQIVSDLSFNSPKNPDHMYTSKGINTQKIAKILALESAGIF
ncbi:9418_t:CDS:2, partial [Racocetra persica]